jgi:hypothetical protein
MSFVEILDLIERNGLGNLQAKYDVSSYAIGPASRESDREKERERETTTETFLLHFIEILFLFTLYDGHACQCS